MKGFFFKNLQRESFLTIFPLSWIGIFFMPGTTELTYVSVRSTTIMCLIMHDEAPLPDDTRERYSLTRGQVVMVKRDTTEINCEVVTKDGQWFFKKKD